MARSIVFLGLTAVLLAAAPPAPVAGAAALSVSVDSFETGRVIPPAYGYCVPAAAGHTAPGPNVSPRISWSRGPAGTASYAILAVDPDVPAAFTDADKEGRVIPAGVKRRPFYHWVLADIPPSRTALAEGEDSNGAAAKPAGPTGHGARGLNDFGDGRAGYDGPCPPWNDAIAHHYHFQVYALDIAHPRLPAAFTGSDVRNAIRGRVLAQGEVVGLYALNPAVARTLPR
jgi:Raf kinase inhibitor-like YbhB/YbcL family protein